MSRWKRRFIWQLHVFTKEIGFCESFLHVCRLHVCRLNPDTLRLRAAEYQALQVRWSQDAQSLDATRQELEQARDELAQEREQREQAEVETLRATVRLSTLEPLVAQLLPASAAGSGLKPISSEETPSP
ncbi:hypothetical protein [Xanthomonas campestris]|uniref:hypothetical protein n=1 Tax=Xanthomonas campestris TaxID=339 RepID=UPI003D02E8C9